MEDPQFAYTLRELLPGLNKAAAEAMALLPQEMLTAHYIATKHGPNAWEAVEAEYGPRPDTTPLQKVALTALVGIVNAHQRILGVLQYAKSLNAGAPDLRLGKQRLEGYAK